MVRGKRKGQSTLEYVLLVTAVIVVMIGLLMGDNSPFRSTLKNSMNSSIGYMGTMSTRLINSH